MLAAGFTQTGAADVVEAIELPTPRPGPGEVLIRVAAATVNPADTMLRKGLIAYVTAPLPHVPGLECAGTVAEAGAGSRWRPGQRVAAVTSFIPDGIGAHAEYLLVPDAGAAEVPRGLSLAAAATVPMSGLTARLAIDRCLAARARTVAVTGAGGAVGAFCLELARYEGIETLAVVRPAYAGRVAAMGAAHTVDAVGDWPAAIRAIHPHGVDAVIDCALLGEACVPAIRDRGQLVTVRGFAGTLDRGVTAQPISVRDYREEGAKLARLLMLAGTGRLSTFVHRTVPFAQAAEAHRLVEAGGMGGRVVLTFDPEAANGAASQY